MNPLEFTRLHDDIGFAIATAIEGVDDPKIQDVRIIDVFTGEIVARTSDLDYEDDDEDEW